VSLIFFDKKRRKIEEKMENGKWKMENGKWKMEKEKEKEIGHEPVEGDPLYVLCEHKARSDQKLPEKVVLNPVLVVFREVDPGFREQFN